MMQAANVGDQTPSCTPLPSERKLSVRQVAMLPMQNALYQAAVNNFRSQAAAARRRPAPKSGTAAAHCDVIPHAHDPPP